REGQHLGGEGDLAQERLVRDEALARERGRAREVGPARHSREREEERRHALARDAAVAEEEEREDDRREDGLDDRPADADRRLLVLHLHLAQDERPQHLAEVPELRERVARQPAGAADDLEHGHRRSSYLNGQSRGSVTVYAARIGRRWSVLKARRSSA